MLKWGLPGRGSNLLKSRRPLTSSTPGVYIRTHRPDTACPPSSRVATLTRPTAHNTTLGSAVGCCYQISTARYPFPDKELVPALFSLQQPPGDDLIRGDACDGGCRGGKEGRRQVHTNIITYLMPVERHAWPRFSLRGASVQNPYIGGSAGTRHRSKMVNRPLIDYLPTVFANTI